MWFSWGFLPYFSLNFSNMLDLESQPSCDSIDNMKERYFGPYEDETLPTSTDTEEERWRDEAGLTANILSQRFNKIVPVQNV